MVFFKIEFRHDFDLVTDHVWSGRSRIFWYVAFTEIAEDVSTLHRPQSTPTRAGRIDAHAELHALDRRSHGALESGAGLKQ